MADVATPDTATPDPSVLTDILGLRRTEGAVLLFLYRGDW